MSPAAPADSGPPEPKPAGSLAAAALSGVAWNWVGSGVLIVAQVASTAATARLVAPREFGLYATALAASALAGYFTLAAVGPGIQRRRALAPRTAGTAMSLSLVASVAVALILWLAAGPWARAWGIPDAEEIVRIIAIALLLRSTATVPLALIRRQLRFRLAAIVETGSVVIGLSAGVALAVGLHSAVALALGQAIGAAALLLATLLIVGAEVRPAADRDDARELFAFSGKVGGLGVLSFLTITAPSWFVARVFGPFSLGLYSRASLLVGLPADYALTSIFKVTFPLYGRVRHDPRRTRLLVDEALTLSTGLAWPFFGFVAGASPVIVAVLLGERWSDAAPLLSLFALWAAGTLPYGVLTNAAEAFGWLARIALRQLAYLAAVAVSLLICRLADLQIEWVLVGVALSQWLAYGLTLPMFARREMVDAAEALRAQLQHAAFSLAVFALAVGASEALAGFGLSAQVAGQIGVALLAIALFCLPRPWLPGTRLLAKRMGGPGESLAVSARRRIRRHRAREVEGVSTGLG